MSRFPEWLAGVLDRGESVQAGPPVPRTADRGAVVALLDRAYRLHALDVGGPPLPFDPAVAFEAAAVLEDGCWAVASGAATAAPADRLVDPRSAAAHLSADVALRFLPAVLQRAKARGPTDPVVPWAETILRRWPLSGVLADEAADPLTPPTFDGHPGLCLLYAERLAAKPRAGWVPADGTARDQVERVFHRSKLPLPRSVPQESP